MHVTCCLGMTWLGATCIFGMTVIGMTVIGMIVTCHDAVMHEMHGIVIIICDVAATFLSLTWLAPCICTILEETVSLTCFQRSALIATL